MREVNKVIDVVVEDNRVSNAIPNEPQQKPRGQEEIGIGTCIVVTALEFGGMVGIWGLIGGAILGLLIGLVFCRKKGEQAPGNAPPPIQVPPPPSDTSTPENQEATKENSKGWDIFSGMLIVLVFALVFALASMCMATEYGGGIIGFIKAFAFEVLVFVILLLILYILSKLPKWFITESIITGIILYVLTTFIKL